MAEAQLHSSIVRYLKAKLASVADPDALSVGIDVICEAFGVTDTSGAADLLEVFSSGLSTLKPSTTSSAKFQSFLESLKSKGFFSGTEEGSPEYKERYAKALSKYEQRLSAEEKGAGAAPAVSVVPPAAVVRPDVSDEVGAEASKEEGNRHVSAQRYAQAVECYTDALEKAPTGKCVLVSFCAAGPLATFSVFVSLAILLIIQKCAYLLFKPSSCTHSPKRLRRCDR